jgi:hypothetical protein
MKFLILRVIERRAPATGCDRLGRKSMEVDMSLLSRPLYQRSEGADEDRWRLVFDTDANRLFVEHHKTRGDMRGAGYSTDTDEMDVTAFLAERGQGQHALVQLLGTLFTDCEDAARIAIT